MKFLHFLCFLTHQVTRTLQLRITEIASLQHTWYGRELPGRTRSAESVLTDCTWHDSLLPRWTGCAWLTHASLCAVMLSRAAEPTVIGWKWSFCSLQFGEKKKKHSNRVLFKKVVQDWGTGQDCSRRRLWPMQHVVTFSQFALDEIWLPRSSRSSLSKLASTSTRAPVGRCFGNSHVCLLAYTNGPVCL